MNAELSDLLRKLRPVADSAPIKSQHWVVGDNEGINYCHDCADARVAQLKVAKPDGEFIVDGGWGAYESDTCVHCETCGALLEYTLTDYGVASELDHYSRHMKRKGKLPPEEAYHIVAALEQLEWSEDKKQVSRAVRIGLRAVALMAA